METDDEMKKLQQNVSALLQIHDKVFFDFSKEKL